MLCAAPAVWFFFGVMAGWVVLRLIFEARYQEMWLEERRQRHDGAR